MVKTDNRSVGGRFEQELAEILAANGFWCHVMQQNKAGQPADIIAVKGKFHTLIDCKVISDNKGFSTTEARENQRLAMKKFHSIGKEMCYFALRLPDGSIYFLPFTVIYTVEHVLRQRVISEKTIREHLMPLEGWLNDTNTWAEDI